MRQIEVLGVPSSMGGFAPGQERAPAALRAAGLLERLGAAGFDVHDRGDARVRRWFPDTARPRAQHVEAVRSVAVETASRVEDTEGLVLVLGGDCTVELGVLAGLQASREGRLGLFYFDLHADLNLPGSVDWGAFDSMGTAHALAVDGADPILARAFPRSPLLDPADLWLFSHGEGMEGEREHIARLGIRRTPVEDVEADARGSASAALDAFAVGLDHLAVHLDVDVIDFVSLPVSENANRNEGLSFEATIEALTVILAHPAVVSLTICELNPDHDPDGSAVPRFIDGIARALSGTG